MRRVFRGCPLWDMGVDYQYFSMNYLAQMLRDCSKNKSTSFNELSFPIIEEIKNKIRTKNTNLRKKIKQRLIDRQKIARVEEKKEEPVGNAKKEALMSKVEKEVINYIEAYDDQRSVPAQKSLACVEDAYLDERDSEVAFNIYILLRKRKSLFKVEQVKRKIRNKENLKRMSLKQCDCCERVGRHRCAHRFCEGKCERLRKGDKSDYNVPQEFDQEEYAVELAQEVIQQAVKQEGASLSVVRIVQKEEEALSIPKIDITEREQAEQEILNERERISQNESKSDISESKRNIRSGEPIVQPLLKPIQAKGQQQPIVQQYQQPRDDFLE